MWHIIRAVLLLFPRIIISYFSWMLSYSRKRDGIPVNKRYKKSRKIIVKACRALKCDLMVEGKENIPSEVCCFFSNHLSASDPIIFFDALDDKEIAFLAKIEIAKLPFVGRVFKSDLGLFLDRDNLKQQLRIMMQVQDSLKRKEISWVVFPEGTRNKDHMNVLLPFHHGTFRPAMKAGVPLVPTVIYGGYRILGKRHNFKKYPTYIKFLKPIYPVEYEGKTTEEVATMIRSRIQQELTFNTRKIDHERMVKMNDKFYRFNRFN